MSYVSVNKCLSKAEQNMKITLNTWVLFKSKNANYVVIISILKKRSNVET